MADEEPKTEGQAEVTPGTPAPAPPPTAEKLAESVPSPQTSPEIPPPPPLLEKAASSDDGEDISSRALVGYNDLIKLCI